MAFDGMMVRAISTELRNHLQGARISKIYQPDERDLVFHFRARGIKQTLFVSANPTYPRIHLTAERLPNPQEAPLFCMVLRKHFEGGIIENIEQVDMERIIHLNVRTKDELGDSVLKRLVIEIMGRHSNIIAVDPQENTILDSIHHLSPAVNQHRTVLPGRKYVGPPEQNKLHPFAVNQEIFAKKIDFNQGRLERQIVLQFSGISPLLAQEIVHLAGLPNRENVFTAFQQVMQKIKRQDFQPTIVQQDNKSFFYLFPLKHIGEGKQQTYADISAMIETFYRGKAERDRMKQKAQDLIRFLTNEKKKNEKKIHKLHHTLGESEKADEYQLYGEMLTAYMHQVKRGDTSVDVVNYYDTEGGMLTIPLDPQLTPNENAQMYFKKYTKAKKATTAAEKQIDIAQDEIAYFETLLQQLEHASARDVEGIREELVEGGYVRDRSTGRKKKKKNTAPELHQYRSSEGITILVGKNNKQNEYLTNRLASPDNTWLHTKDIPGSHVVIRSKQFSKQTLLEAAQLAAYFSKAGHSSQVPVDYTLIKHVRKPNGAKPGFVIYDHQKTIFVTPVEEEVQRLAYLLR